MSTTQKFATTAQLNSAGMIVTPPAVKLHATLTADGTRITAAPHPLNGSPDLWLIQIWTGGEVTDEILIRPAEMPTIRRILAMAEAAVQDTDDELEADQ